MPEPNTGNSKPVLSVLRAAMSLADLTWSPECYQRCSPQGHNLVMNLQQMKAEQLSTLQRGKLSMGELLRTSLQDPPCDHRADGAT